MMTLSGLLYIAGALAVAVIVTLIGLFVVRVFTRNLLVLTVVSGLIFPSLLVGLAFYLARSDGDPHGWLIAGSIMLALISAPVTLLTGAVAARRL